MRAYSVKLIIVSRYIIYFFREMRDSCLKLKLYFLLNKTANTLRYLLSRR